IPYDKYKYGDMIQMVVTGTAAQLPTPNPVSGVDFPERVVLQTLSTNTHPIFLKNAADVAVDGSTGGHEMPPASNLELAVKDYTTFYAISASGSQRLQITFLGWL